MTSLEQRLAGLSADQRRLVERWLREQAVAAHPPAAARIPRRPAADVCPLAFAQQPLWFVQQWDPDSAAFNFPIAVRLRGPCDMALLEHSLAAIVQRHEVLRTTFPAANGQPQQLIAPGVPLRLRRVDLAALPLRVRAAQAERLARTETARPFDLERGPLLRTQVLRLDADEHVLLITLHHIVFDDWSQGVLLRELIALYTAAGAGHAAPLPPLPIQYGDYATWQRQHLPGSRRDEQLAFWTAQLRNAPPLLEVPTDYPRPPIRSTRGAVHTFAIPALVADGLNALSRPTGATLFMTLLAAFDVLLARQSGQDDIVVGAPIAGRSRSELEGMIGLFVNVLPLRMNLAGNPPFRELLQRMRAVALAAYAHQDVVFEQLIDALAIERDPSRHPIFQVILALQNAPMPALAGAGLRVEPLEMERTTAHYELGLSLREGADGLRGRLEYSTDLFMPATIQRLCEQFVILLAGVLADPDQRIAALPLLTAAEREQVLVAWNATQTPYPPDRSLPMLVQVQAARTPDAVALVFREQHLSYAELEQRASQLAHYLRAQQVGPEVRVGVCLERSIALVVALLGVLTAGAAYVPLDPAYPAERLRFMLDDSQAAVLLVAPKDEGQGPTDEERGRSVAVRLSSFVGQVLDLHADWPLIAQQPTRPPALPRLTDQLAYIIYTSGSTGTPKGVLVSHRGLSNVLPYAGTLFALAGHSRVLQVASISFDASVLELFAALAHGACVVMLALEQLAGGSALEQVLKRQAITTMIVTPSFLELLPAGAYPQLRTISLGGERCSAATLARWASGRRVLNVYAPTEATIFATAWRADGPAASLAPPLGRPIANMQLYLLDRHLQPVPIGVTGEIYLSGVGLARGYHGRPDLTAERFVPNPFATNDETDARPVVLGPASAVRLYRTGDLARVRADGQIEFLGRRDDQIKLRGYRIELGEIAAVLCQHALIHEAVVVAHAAGPHDQRLVAYVVLSNDERRTANDAEGAAPAALRPASFVQDVRDHLQQRLPEYMIPAVFVRLDALPLTPTGKLDRRALPKPTLRAESAAVAPRDRLELQLVQLWEELLDVRPIGVTDSFFALGGHSLLAVRLMARLRELTGVALPIATLFHHPTIAQLARVLRDQAAPAAPSALVGIATGGTNRPLFCVHPLGGNVLCYAQLARQLGPAQPVYGIQSLGLERDQALPTDVESMAAEYVAAIRTFQPIGPYLLCGWSVGGLIALEIAQQLGAQGQPVALLALIDSYTPQAMALPMPEDRQLLAMMARQLDLALDPAALRPLDAEQQLAYVLAQAQRSDAPLPGLDLAQLGRLFAVYKSNAHALLRYTPRPYAGRVTLFRAAVGLGGVDPALGWDALAGAGVALCDVPGEHDTLLKEPHVRALAEQLSAAIRQAALEASLAT
jgi:amino acid adenylation domain-containing protein